MFANPTNNTVRVLLFISLRLYHRCKDTREILFVFELNLNLVLATR